jgi:Ssp1 endopeptidase immunity protein Rap1a
MNIRTIAAAVAVAISTSTATAGDDGNTWAAKCNKSVEQARSTKEAMEFMHCVGFTRGVADTIALWRGAALNAAEGDKAPACIPEKATTQQLVDIGLKFIRENPAERHIPASALLMRAFHAVWPCKK